MERFLTAWQYKERAFFWGSYKCSLSLSWREFFARKGPTVLEERELLGNWDLKFTEPDRISSINFRVGR